MLRLFSDQSERYLSPVQPKSNEKVSIRLRVPKSLGPTEGNVYFLPQKNPGYYKHAQMELIMETKHFKFFEAVFVMPERIIRYHFEVRVLNSEKSIFYDAVGVVKNRAVEDFILIPDVRYPEWAKGAIYYQIFVDRFYNGDKSNDVTDGEYIYDNFPVSSKKWSDMPQKGNGHREFYGGDILGVMKKLDYIKALGAEVIYLNPVFVSPSPHKYDTQDYNSIDPHFGVITENHGSYREITKSRKNLDASNRLFSDFMKKCHENNIKVVLDGVFNHCGSENEWLDNPQYRDFFYWNKENEYEGWWGYQTLPKLNYGTLKVWQAISGIGRRWVEEPYCIDGWRLDVASDLGKSKYQNISFWRYFSKLVKKSNPDAVVFAEMYSSPKEWIEYKAWDSVMNYNGFMEPVSFYLTGMEKHNEFFSPELYLNAGKFIVSVIKAYAQLPMQSRFIALNQLSNHDHSRWMTRTTKVFGALGEKSHLQACEGVDIEVFKTGLIMLYTFPGAKGLYYGDEIGMSGWTDPDNRRPFPWDSMTDENISLLEFCKKINAFYLQNTFLRTATFEFTYYTEHSMVYICYSKDDFVVVAVNPSQKTEDLQIDLSVIDVENIYLVSEISNNGKKYSLKYEGEPVTFSLDERTSVIFKKSKSML
ncbi:MAG TPA: glycoside hydrolase family 13 protein [Petrotogaceae bacterium]|nr:glycoside hydrolase family 13 protein [Petrotogaceae bacterium]